MRQTMRWMVVAACMLGVLNSPVVAQDKPASIPQTPGGTAGGMAPGKTSAMPGAGAEKMGMMPGKKAMPAMGPVNLNTADEAMLRGVKGIGPVKAKAIVAYRQQNGPFKSVDDLKKVKGIGDKTLAQLKDQVTVQ